MDGDKARVLTFSILRFNPRDAESRPQMERFELEEADGMTLFLALNEIRETQAPSLKFDFVCRAGICGSCQRITRTHQTSLVSRHRLQSLHQLHGMHRLLPVWGIRRRFGGDDSRRTA